MEGTRRPLVGVLLVNYGSYDLTRRCLESIRAVDYSPRMIVVVDNAMDAGVSRRLENDFPEAVVLPQQENTGFARGCNIGIRHCLEKGCDAVLLLNNDSIVEPDFLGHLVSELTDETIVVPQTLSITDPQRVSSYAGSFDWARGLMRPLYLGWSVERVPHERAQITMAGGSCLLFPRRLFEEVGLFDESFFLYFEDVDLLARSTLAGYRIVHQPRAVVYHDPGAGMGPNVSAVAYYYATRNRLYLMAKHVRGWRRVVFLSYFYATRPFHIIRFMVHRRFRMIAIMARAIADFRAGRMSRAAGHDRL